MNAHMTLIALGSVVAVSAVGCISVKTESEVKPIHITMDVNLKVDKELDKAFADEDKAKGSFKPVKDALDRQAVGIDNKGMFVARSGATDDDRILVTEENGRRRKRFEAIAKESGVSYDSVCKRRANQMVERIPAGKGVWYQDESGKWLQK